MQKRADLTILGESNNRVQVADGTVSTGKHRVQLQFKQLSKKANEADTFKNFSNYLLSVGKVNEDGNMSIFTSDEVTVHKEEDVLITCKGKPILVGIRDDCGRYRIPLV